MCSLHIASFASEIIWSLLVRWQETDASGLELSVSERYTTVLWQLCKPSPFAQGDNEGYFTDMVRGLPGSTAQRV